MRSLFKVAVIEDDRPTSNQLPEWILWARPGIRVDQWFTRDDAEAAIARDDCDLVLPAIELGRERHTGVAIITAINKSTRGTPVLVVSAMPMTICRGIMKALDASDHLQKTTFSDADFFDTYLEILRDPDGSQEVDVPLDRARRTVFDAEIAAVPGAPERLN